MILHLGFQAVIGLVLTGGPGTPQAARVCIAALGPQPLAMVERTRLVATSILQGAGVEMTLADRCLESAGAFDFRIWLSQASASQPGQCGRATRNRDGVGGTIVLSVPCLNEVWLKAIRSTDPRLTRTQPGDIAGVALAHELGHLLGLRHGGEGVMRSRLDLADLAALVEGRLAFVTAEAAAMRAALTQLTADTNVRRER